MKQSAGAGTELAKLLRRLGINPKEQGCKCKSRARQMDKEGLDWCESNRELIVTWLQEEAAKRHLPFLRAAGRLLVRRAIQNAKKNR